MEHHPEMSHGVRCRQSMFTKQVLAPWTVWIPHRGPPRRTRSSELEERPGTGPIEGFVPYRLSLAGRRIRPREPPGQGPGSLGAGEASSTSRRRDGGASGAGFRAKRADELRTGRTPLRGQPMVVGHRCDRVCVPHVLTMATRSQAEVESFHSFSTDLRSRVSTGFPQTPPRSRV